jgi:hypothetical protein
VGAWRSGFCAITVEASEAAMTAKIENTAYLFRIIVQALGGNVRRKPGIRSKSG